MRNTNWLKLPLMLMMGAFICFGLILWRNKAKPEGALEVGQRSVILYNEAAHPLFTQCSRPAPVSVDGLWSPSASDIRDLESNLPRFLTTQQLRDGSPLKPHLSQFLNYYKQYAGFSRNQRKMIYFNAFSDPSENWRQAAIVPCDGGEIAFGVEYDVESGQFDEFHFNGALY